MEKVMNTYYISPDTEREMRIRAAELGLRFPTEFILMLWDKFKEKDTNAGK